MKHLPSPALAMSLSILLLASSLSARRPACPGQAEPAKSPFATSLLFSFHSDCDVSLHHFLYRWAKKQAMEAGGIPKRYPAPITDAVTMSWVRSPSASV